MNNNYADSEDESEEREFDDEAYIISVTGTSRATADVRAITLTRTDRRDYEELNARLIFCPELIENPAYPEASVRGVLMYQKRHTPNEPWHDADHFDLRHLRAGEEIRLELRAGELRRLVKYVEHLSQVAPERPDRGEIKTFVVAPEEDVVISDKTRQQDMAKFLKIFDNLDEDVWDLIKEERPGLLDLIALKRRHEVRRQALDFFQRHFAADDWSEGEWQKFFENHEWIFGHNLVYQFVTPVAYQPHYGGEDVFGKDDQRGDFLMATAARARFTVLVDIKKPNAPLLSGNRQYRNGAYAISREVSGGISQLLANRETWIIDGSTRRSNMKQLSAENIITAEPRAVLVIGNLAELDDDTKKASFERFRRTLHNLDIITFDELLERAVFMLESEVYKNHDDAADSLE